jgi:hypothetical protein
VVLGHDTIKLGQNINSDLVGLDLGDDVVGLHGLARLYKYYLDFSYK